MEKEVLGNRKVHLGVGCVDYDIHVGLVEELTVISKRLAAGIYFLCHAASVFVCVYHVFYVIVFVFVASVVFAVNVLAASALTNYGYVKLFHNNPLSDIYLHTNYKF